MRVLQTGFCHTVSKGRGTAGKPQSTCVAMESTGSADNPRRKPITITKDNVDGFLQQFDNIVCDCDGVLWLARGDVPGAREALKSLRAHGKRLFFVTNNSVQPALERLDTVHFPVRKDEVVYPILAISQHLQNIGFTGKAYVLGSEAAKDKLRQEGIAVEPGKRTGGLMEESMFAFVEAMKRDTEVRAVILDVDVNLRVVELNNAANFLRNPECLFLVGACDDIIAVVNEGIILGPAYFQRLLEEFAGRKAQAFGKPEPAMIEYLNDAHKLDTARTVFVGDSLKEDMGFANACGLKKLLVFTGKARPDHLDKCDPKLVPDFVIESIGDFAHLLLRNTQEQ